MTFYSLQVVNAEVVKKSMQDLNREIPRISRHSLYRTAQRVKGRYNYTKSNPTPRGKYVRTFTMRDSREVIKTDDGYVFAMNPVNEDGTTYGAYVVGTFQPDSQAWPFRERWPALREVVIEETAKLPKEVLQALGLVIKRNK